MAPVQSQTEDTTIWQATGREVFVEWARRDSVAASMLQANLLEHDLRFLTLAEYDDNPAGLFSPEHQAALARYGERRLRVNEISAVLTAPDGETDSWNFTGYYNAALFAFVAASDSLRRDFLAHLQTDTPYEWSPFPKPRRPPAERPLMQVSDNERDVMMDAALRLAMSKAGANARVAVDAELGSDGVYSLARKGRHPAGWLASVMARHLVVCVVHSTEYPCPTMGELTTIKLNQPRHTAAGLIEIHTSVTTVMRLEETHQCGFGCFFGTIYEAWLVRADEGWRAEVGGELIIN